MKNVNREQFSENFIGSHKYVESIIGSMELKHKSVLDIGCGFGWFIYQCLQFEPSFIGGIEISEVDLETAKNDERLQRAEFLVGSALATGYPDSFFDLVTAWEVLEHIPKGSEQLMFDEFYRILKPNGIAIISTPYKDLRSIALDPAFYFGHRHYSLKRILEFSYKSNLLVQSAFVKGGWPQILFMMNLYLSKWIFRRGPFFLRSFSKILEKDWDSRDGFSNVYVKLQKSVYL
jgi:ubiquinone/menaquinone biosynthesis C-methylase UbiE